MYTKLTIWVWKYHNIGFTVSLVPTLQTELIDCNKKKYKYVGILSTQAIKVQTTRIIHGMKHIGMYFDHEFIRQY